MASAAYRLIKDELSLDGNPMLKYARMNYSRPCLIVLGVWG